MKKCLYSLLCVLIDGAVIGLIPLNMTLLNRDIPEFVCVVGACLSVLCTVLLFVKSGAGKILKTLACVLTVLTMVVSVLGSYCNPYWNGIFFREGVSSYSKPYDHRLSSAEAVADLRYAMKYLKKVHPALRDGVPQDLGKRYDRVKADLEQRDGIGMNELARQIESVFSPLRDAHTYVRANYENLRILRYAQDWEDNGDTITAVNDVSIEKLLEQKASYYSFEVSSWQKEWLLGDVITVEGLDYLGFDAAKGITYTLTAQDGQVSMRTCGPQDFRTRDKATRNTQTKRNEDDFVRYEIDAEHSLALLTFDECEYNQTYIDCIRKMFKEVKAKHIKNVAVDLRENGGGNSLVVNEFFRYLDIDEYKTPTSDQRLGFLINKSPREAQKNEKYDDLLFTGELYLLVSTNTFSSAMFFAQMVQDNKLGTLIGQAPGNAADGYGDIAAFKLPNSQLYMQISTKQWYRADRSNKSSLVEPDVSCASDEVLSQLYGHIA